ncbi:RagB/SusD family nutrient uptake outer membrane protein [Chitinophaga polysaccharea]|uniref:RagB/SusD family nutrient uptake outer membrane protein n=1 Tax=Chitinophaga TaxID=79328 RepID=UPI001454ED20|nr:MULTISPECIES: RagB/SusD family nutrient uptake outer membrane protein [Chitinophaga]NLR59484.1 RagB/SusD family nutrient uptake outer membrane protein [Chitinophaga polysaccharea]NLU96118.1 RagB/SusD family nutrient uptake outer membrane protein [Chitinophaga sp. Ak27]
MFRRITYIVTLLLFMTPLGCKKFLDVKPLDRLSGNTFFQNRNDVESNLWDIYGLFRDAAGSCPLFAAAGEMRGGQMEMSPQKNDGNDRTFLVSIAKNDLSNVVNTPGGKDFWNIFKLWNLSDWRPFYRIIQASNILVYELDHRKIADITDTDIKGYQAEAIFMRCMTYFIMVRLWGDVPYYTDAYHDAPLSREKMVTVMNNCIADLGKVKDNLQWTFNDPANQGAKASRGAALALMMEMSMWNAGFDKGNAQQYYTQTAQWGDELIKSGAYDLLPIEQSFTIFKGRSKESLFDIVINSNYGETLGDNWNDLSEFVVHWPYKRPAAGHQYSFSYIRADFLRRLYPTGVPDARATTWFDSQMYANDGTFLFLKYSSIFEQGENDKNVDNDLILLRYAGAILLRAEALAALNKDAEAIRMLNMIRNRAKTTLYQGQGGPALKDAIYIESAKELMMEGHYYFDLVRTGRVMNQQWCYYPLTQSQFENGGWTWPISPAALNNNPGMQLNNYWSR